MNWKRDWRPFLAATAVVTVIGLLLNRLESPNIKFDVLDLICVFTGIGAFVWFLWPRDEDEREFRRRTAALERWTLDGVLVSSKTGARFVLSTSEVDDTSGTRTVTLRFVPIGHDGEHRDRSGVYGHWRIDGRLLVNRTTGTHFRIGTDLSIERIESGVVLRLKEQAATAAASPNS